MTEQMTETDQINDKFYIIEKYIYDIINVETKVETKVHYKNLIKGTKYSIKVNLYLDDSWAEYTGVFVENNEGNLTFTNVTIDNIDRCDINIHTSEPYCFSLIQ
jgi:hypothetical protein